MTVHVQRRVDWLNKSMEDPADSDDGEALASDSEQVGGVDSHETDDSRTETGAGNESRK